MTPSTLPSVTREPRCDVGTHQENELVPGSRVAHQLQGTKAERRSFSRRLDTRGRERRIRRRRRSRRSSRSPSRRRRSIFLRRPEPSDTARPHRASTPTRFSASLVIAPRTFAPCETNGSFDRAPRPVVSIEDARGQTTGPTKRMRSARPPLRSQWEAAPGCI
jgi:hypothetical protein